MCFWDKGKYQENPVKSRRSAILQIPKNRMIFEKTLFWGNFLCFWGTYRCFWEKVIIHLLCTT